MTAKRLRNELKNKEDQLQEKINNQESVIAETNEKLKMVQQELAAEKVKSSELE